MSRLAYSELTVLRACLQEKNLHSRTKKLSLFVFLPWKGILIKDKRWSSCWSDRGTLAQQCPYLVLDGVGISLRAQKLCNSTLRIDEELSKIPWNRFADMLLLIIQTGIIPQELEHWASLATIDIHLVEQRDVLGNIHID